jgi:hypothetical protein
LSLLLPNKQLFEVSPSVCPLCSTGLSKGPTCRGISFLRLNDGKTVARKDFLFEAVGVSTDETGVLVDSGLENQQGHQFGLRLHMHAVSAKGCDVFNESEEEEAAIAAKTAHLSFLVEPSFDNGNGKFEYSAREFHKVSLEELLSYHDTEKEVVAIGVFFKRTMPGGVPFEHPPTAEELMAKYG